MMAIQDELTMIAKKVEDSLRACIPTGWLFLLFYPKQ
jgi:hypothetical protein